MWNRLLNSILNRIIRKGTLELHLPDGTHYTYGDGSGTAVVVRITDPSTPRRMVLNPELAVGEAYMDGTLTIDGEDLYGLLRLAQSNLSSSGPVLWLRPLDMLRTAGRSLAQFNPVRRAQRNVAHHYDLSGELYDLFLDKDRQYSCAYFRHDGDTLEQAQEQKKHLIARKLLLKPGMRVLDIGCGWGGMALTLAKDYDVHVLGITLSEEQHKIAEQRARDAGLQDRVQFRLMDYRDVAGTYERIVSVGMFEHVGVPHYQTFFAHLRDRLTEDGVALLHTIGRADQPTHTSPWLAKYIFPGGYTPALSEVMQAIEKENLYTTDIEVLRLHYAKTLHEWHRRFMANIDKARDLYDERFCRMWQYYLVSAEQSFRYYRQTVFQIQLTRQQDAVPLTRDYLYPSETSEQIPAAPPSGLRMVRTGSRR